MFSRVSSATTTMRKCTACDHLLPKHQVPPPPNLTKSIRFYYRRRVRVRPRSSRLRSTSTGKEKVRSMSLSRASAGGTRATDRNWRHPQQVGL
ncbi:hypothetical protein RHSIM_Rhsim06G0115100 [Rhododendron simsii]|uniref:Uncharacterized protein n=1 Tax=Rhododendron simsii TaxID=118357 RepID=A0A834GU06_RHOSS|nr:hypothetical protein RHSIM_Rhsim06G0115100 [Rhododendron simsii]